MKCTLMHKRLAVAELELDETTGFILKIDEVYQPEHLPVGVSFKNGIAERGQLNEWWTDRSIPASRSGVRNALENLNITNTKALLVRCFGLSLSDQYWIKPQDSDITWDKINFFENAFSEDIGDVLFGRAMKKEGFDFSSPDNTSDGCLKKRWKIIDGKRCLIKGGSDIARQQPFNEVIATKIMQRLNIPHVPYTMTWDNGSPYSVCEDFITSDTELVAAWRIINSKKKSNNMSVYQHFVSCCKDFGITDIEQSLDKMLVLDYIIANEDRHLNNFGLVRNAETLEWIGFAPIYDSGSSLGYDKLPTQIRMQADITCKPFKKSHIEQLKLVSDFSWIDFDKLADIDEIIKEVMSTEEASELIDERRITAISDAVRSRIDVLQNMAMTHTPVEDTTEGDVEEDIAEDYQPKMM